MKILANLSRLCAQTSRWSLALGLALLFVGIWAWLDVSLRMLPQPTPLITERESPGLVPLQDHDQAKRIARRVANPAR